MVEIISKKRIIWWTRGELNPSKFQLINTKKRRFYALGAPFETKWHLSKLYTKRPDFIHSDATVMPSGRPCWRCQSDPCQCRVAA